MKPDTCLVLEQRLLVGSGYTSETRHITPLTPRREVYPHPITKTKLTLILTLSLIPTLILLTLLTLVTITSSSCILVLPTPHKVAAQV